MIGKFCQLATGLRFIMNGSNHPMQGISTYPFKAFGGDWAKKDPFLVSSKGDTVIGNDVWIGNSATIMQGIQIGHGAIIGTNSLVTKDVAPYTIRPLSKDAFMGKMALSVIFFVKFFDHMYTYALKIFQKICAKSAHFAHESLFRKKSIVGGNPAQVIRPRFDQETIAFLLELAWWNWDLQMITEHLEAIATAHFPTLKRIHAQRQALVGQ